MKRVVEEVTELDTQIGSLFEEGQSKTTNSDRSIFLSPFQTKNIDNPMSDDTRKCLLGARGWIT